MFSIISLNSLPKSILLLLFVFLCRCLNKKKSQENSDGTNDRHSPESEALEKTSSDSYTPQTNSTNTPPVEEDSVKNTNDLCAWNENENTINLDHIPLASELYEASIRLFGTPKSALLAILLPKYQHGDLRGLYVSSKQGDLISYKAISEIGHIDVDSTLMPVIFDNVTIGSTRFFTLLFETIEGKLFKFELKEKINFDSDFRGLKAYGVGYPYLSNDDHYDFFNQNVFAPEISQFKILLEQSEIIKVSQEFSFRKFYFDPNVFVTDFFGNELKEDPQSSTSFSRNNFFICYVLSKKKNYYLRSLIKLT